MHLLIHPTYFPSIAHFVAMLKAEKITFEVEGNFQKQTNRNRTYIYSPNGKQLLNVPVKKGTSDAHQLMRDVQIDYSENWQKMHFKSMEMAYRSSPFFEYFEDEIRSLFEAKTKFLLDYNFQIFQTLQDCLGTKLTFDTTTEYFKEVPAVITDRRDLVVGKKSNFIFEPYTQVFEHVDGFLSDLSVLDVLFNEGRYAVDYLKKQTL